MNVLVIGNGGREHALAWKIAQSSHCDKLFVAPGNAGTASVAENVPIAVSDFAGLAQFCVDSQVGLVVVGPEVPLVAGIRDYFEADSRLSSVDIVGPGKAGAQLEGSKEFSKQFMAQHKIPTAKARSFDGASMRQAVEYISNSKPPIVLKADGLAAGKGVVICQSVEEAQNEIREMLIDKKFGEAGARVLVEEFLDGIELSVFVLTDGTDYVILPEAKDYKRIGEGDTGPNTGGMGAISPVGFADAHFMKKVEDQVVKPTISGLAADHIPYKGFIFIGLMNVAGDPYVIEYNVRMGDPETQAVIPRINNDLVALLAAAGKGNLKGIELEVADDYAATVVMVSGGYPGNYEKGHTIAGVADSYDAVVFHAGTKQVAEAVVTDGGRVLAVTGKGNSLENAVEKAYKATAGISWREMYFRRDIGQDLLKLV